MQLDADSPELRSGAPSPLGDGFGFDSLDVDYDVYDDDDDLLATAEDDLDDEEAEDDDDDFDPYFDEEDE